MPEDSGHRTFLSSDPSGVTQCGSHRVPFVQTLQVHPLLLPGWTCYVNYGLTGGYLDNYNHAIFEIGIFINHFL